MAAAKRPLTRPRRRDKPRPRCSGIIPRRILQLKLIQLFHSRLPHTLSTVRPRTLGPPSSRATRAARARIRQGIFAQGNRSRISRTLPPCARDAARLDLWPSQSPVTASEPPRRELHSRKIRRPFWAGAWGKRRSREPPRQAPPARSRPRGPAAPPLRRPLAKTPPLACTPTQWKRRPGSCSSSRSSSSAWRARRTRPWRRRRRRAAPTAAPYAAAAPADATAAATA
jgi:hypothetical protein